MQPDTSRPEEREHPCGLRRLSCDFYGDRGWSGLHHDGEAGSAWQLVIALFCRQFRRRNGGHATREGQPARSREGRADERSSGNSTQKVVPAPVSVSKPI